MASQEPKLVVDWKRPARADPQASLARFAPNLEFEQARRARSSTRKRGAMRGQGPRQVAIEAATAGRGDDNDQAAAVELDLRPASRLTSVNVVRPQPPARRVDERIRDALRAACADGADRDGAVMAAARECAVPASSLPLVEALLADLILEGALVAYGDVLYARKRRPRKVVAVEVGEDDLMDLLSRGHRVLELD